MALATGRRSRRITMPIDLQQEGGNVLRIELRGTLRQGEVARCQDQVLHEVSRVGPARLVYALDGFVRWGAQDTWRGVGLFVGHGDAPVRRVLARVERLRADPHAFLAPDLGIARRACFRAQVVLN